MLINAGKQQCRLSGDVNSLLNAPAPRTSCSQVGASGGPPGVPTVFRGCVLGNWSHFHHLWGAPQVPVHKHADVKGPLIWGTATSAGGESQTTWVHPWYNRLPHIEALTTHGPCGQGKRRHGARWWPREVGAVPGEVPCVPTPGAPPGWRHAHGPLWAAGFPLRRPRARCFKKLHLQLARRGTTIPLVPPSTLGTPLGQSPPPGAVGGWEEGARGLGCGSCPGHCSSVTATLHTRPLADTGALALSARQDGAQESRAA